jgi:hypothetical protein
MKTCILFCGLYFEFLFQRDEFNYPVFIDEKNLIKKLNNFPQNDEFQCFLLYKDNKVKRPNAIRQDCIAR